MIRYSPKKTNLPKIGDILLSEPLLNDPYFGRKAVLLCEYNEDGAFGLVLNNFVTVSIEDIQLDIKNTNPRFSVGGPVNSSNLYFIHTCGEIENSHEIVDGIFLGGDFSQLKSMIEDGYTSFRFFLGYSGWSEDQLADEIKSRSWFVTRAGADEIMSTDLENEEFWKKLINGMGPGFSHIAEAPLDPSLN